MKVNESQKSKAQGWGKQKNKENNSKEEERIKGSKIRYTGHEREKLQIKPNIAVHRQVIKKTPQILKLYWKKKKKSKKCIFLGALVEINTTEVP